jgi:hypothetical protein
LYLARTEHKGRFTYSLRESYPAAGCLQSREIYKLGPDPGRFVKYPGGNAYYFDEDLVDALEKQGVEDVDNRLDDLLLDFIKPEIRKIIGHFSNRHRSRAEAAANHTPTRYHPFDKRRLLFLKSGTVDQGPIDRLPGKFFRSLSAKSRDELEQSFLQAERALKPEDRKLYTYVVFDLQQHFSSPLAKRFPAAMDGDQLDAYFIKAVCELNDDRGFWHGHPRTEGLPAYLVRYVIMYFDNPFPAEDPMAAWIRDFMRSRRDFRFPDQPGPAMSLTAAAQALGLAAGDLQRMTPTALTRHYRKMAIKLHPDQGGDHDRFIQITEAYQSALQRLRKK